ncbi:MAG: hypothetical protein ACREU7_02040 [Burkholderiales bacterium]
MTAHRATPASESVRKAAAAAYEALPAILLAAALLAPAIAAFAARNAMPDDFDRQAVEVRTGMSITEPADSIAEQGNRALVEIRKESRETLLQNLALPKLS